MSFGKIYETTWWGNPVQGGFGGIYYDLSSTYNEITMAYINRTTAAGFTLEALDCVNDATNNFN